MRLLLFFLPLLLLACSDSFEEPNRFKNQPVAVTKMDGSILQLTYGEKGVLEKERLLSDNGELVEGIYEYDLEGRLRRVRAVGGIDRKVSYQGGELAAIEEVILDTATGNEKLLRRFNINKYEKGRVVEMTVENALNGKKKAYKYEYLSNGNLLRINEYGFDGHSNKTLQRYKRYTYKQRKNLLKGNYAFMTDIPSFFTRNLPLRQTVYSPTDVLVYSEDYEYEFESGKPSKIRVKGIDSAGIDSLLITRFTY